MLIKFLDGTERGVEIKPDANLSGANLSGAYLRGADLRGAAILVAAILAGCGGGGGGASTPAPTPPPPPVVQTQDDTSAVQAAVAAGGVVNLSGTYLLTKSIVVTKSGRSFRAAARSRTNRSRNQPAARTTPPLLHLALTQYRASRLRPI
jgi:uncharacterized protein YjbI with pentapeptide repeats